MAKKDIKIVDLIDRFGKDRVLRALTKRRFTNKKRVEERKTGQKHMGFKKGKKIIVPPKKPKKKYSTDADLPYAMTIDTTTSAYGDAGKGRPVPKYNIGGSPPEFGPGKSGTIKDKNRGQPLGKRRFKTRSSKPASESMKQKEYFKPRAKKMEVGGLVDYYKDII